MKNKEKENSKMFSDNDNKMKKTRSFTVIVDAVYDVCECANEGINKQHTEHSYV